MAKKIGEFIHEKFKSKGLDDKQVAGFLNISPSTLRKTYMVDDLYISRIIKCSKLISEDILLEFYYTKEPLKSFRDKEIQEWEHQIGTLKNENNSQKQTIQQLNDHISTQKELFASLKKEIERLEFELGKKK